MKDVEIESLDEPQIVRTQDESGEFHDFELIEIIHYNEKDYGLLIHVDENQDEDEEEEVLLMLLSKENGAYVFETIEDDEEFNEVLSYLESQEDDD